MQLYSYFRWYNGCSTLTDADQLTERQPISLRNGMVEFKRSLPPSLKRKGGGGLGGVYGLLAYWLPRLDHEGREGWLES